MDESEHDVLAYMAFPRQHCMRRRNNRPLSGAWCNRVAA
jgi:hypothetical protein